MRATMADDFTDYPGGLLDYLPEIYGEDPFLGQYLAAFEKVLLRNPDKGGEPGLEQKIEGIARYFDPMETPTEFLPWLSGWVALSLWADFSPDRQREFIRKAVRLYHRRGTKKGLEELVSVYALSASISETATPFRIESPSGSRLGDDTRLEGGAPFVFRVLVNLGTTDPAQLKKQSDVVKAILKMEKPSHTEFVLEVETPTLQIGVHSQVQVDTLLGEPTTD
jgi:phage tail-like protein